jgi:hypothetical protein
MLKSERYPLFLQGIEMLTKGRLTQLLIMLSVLLGLFFWRTFDNENASLIEPEAQQQENMSMLRCDYQQPCEFLTELGIFKLNIKDLPIKAEEWINFELHVPVQKMQVTEAKIVGKTMFMGKIPVTFKQTAKQLFTAKSLVGACTTAQMVWSLEIMVKSGDNEVRLAFDFMVKR